MDITPLPPVPPQPSVPPVSLKKEDAPFPRERGAFRAAMYGVSAVSWSATLLAIGAIIITGLTIVFLVVFASTTDDSVALCTDGNVAVIPLSGTISSDQIGLDTMGNTYTSYRYLADALDDAANSEDIDAVVLDINSPGGEMVPSAEMATAIERFAQSKPIVSYIRTYGASGAYFAAAATDRIFAHRASEVGSIGVIISYLDEVGRNEQEGYSYVEFKSGPFKSAGSPYRELSDEEAGLFQKFVDDLHQYFVEEVARMRELGVEYIQSLADGSTMLGLEAKEAGLVDEVGDETTVFAYLEEKLGTSATPCYLLTEYRAMGF
jgi:protease-4